MTDQVPSGFGPTMIAFAEVPTGRCGRPQAIVAGADVGSIRLPGDRLTAGLAGGLPGNPAGTPARPDPKGFPARSQSRNRSPQSWQMTRGPRRKLRRSPDASSVEDRSIKRSPQRMQQSRAIMASVLRRRISRNPWRRFTYSGDRSGRSGRNDPKENQETWAT